MAGAELETISGQGSGKNIRSLADLQKAIKKADRVKQSAQTQGKIGEMRRARDKRRKKKLTREERREQRISKRLTVELGHSESRVKVSLHDSIHEDSLFCAG